MTIERLYNQYLADRSTLTVLAHQRDVATANGAWGVAAVWSDIIDTQVQRLADSLERLRSAVPDGEVWVAPNGEVFAQ